MLGRVARHHNKNVSKIQDHGLHMKSFNGRKLNSISPNSTISEKFDFIKTRNFPLSPQNFSITKNRAQKLDSKAKPQNARLLSSSCSNECNNNNLTPSQFSDNFSKATNPFITNIHLNAENKDLKEKNLILTEKINIR